MSETGFKKRIVVKVGTNVMTNRNNRIVIPTLEKIVKQIVHLYENDVITILVSSGSAIAGKELIGDTKFTDPSKRRQVFSSVGQPRLMRHYYEIFTKYGLHCAQVLATKRDFAPGQYRDNMITCYESLLEEGIIPIANEDDAVSLSMSMFSDNDELAGLVAELIDADHLILLTDIDGLYTGNPSDADSDLISEVRPHENVEKYVQDSTKGEGEGRGGMVSKLNIAKEVAAKNISTHIANGNEENIIIDIVEGKNVGTKFTKI